MTATDQHTAPTGSSYADTLRTLSEASVHQHFDAFLDIAWDDPAYVVDPADPRWVLPTSDVLGRHPWYRGLPLERQVEIGLYRQANVTKVGLQFEQVLISGLMTYAFGLRNGSPEFRYSTHEATEECHHTQMFQEFVNRSGQDVAGGTWAFRAVAPFLPLFAKWAPFAFFYGVLAGEEPIDHVQKAVLRAGEDTHPLLRRIMQIHVAEEARHIGFAHQYLEHRAPRLGRVERFALSIIVPLVMRWLGDQILRPGRQARRDMGIPRSVAREVWWRDAESRKFLRDLFADVRMLADRTGLRNPVSRVLWRALGIDGRSSRFRSQPASAAS
ncbi:AurF N-oxygenase family protein [Nocardioides abyssi]|uniref:Diiron oxygenase n=1 Tax=Nocardioides abyssi TaxID=3058370 RepID=A0ABT8ETW5_9ACTN|nr:diiron oxygenase [Nocardioides abyssi]MDN4161623.1 diiron oxygenase [Nocardioides abyssi]